MVAVMSHARRIPCLDGLRGIAALVVVLYHFNGLFLPQARLPHLERAYLSVDLFFLLSGFVMAHVYGNAMAADWRSAWPDFAIARFARLYPLFVTATLALVVIVVVFGTPQQQSVPVSFSVAALALQPFLLQHWYVTLNWDYPSWSISTEAEAYVFFVPAAGTLISGKHSHLMAACCVAVLVILSVHETGSLASTQGLAALLRTLPEFSLGVLLYRAHCRDTVSSRAWAAGVAVLFVLFAWLTQVDLFAICAFACLIYYGANAAGWFGQLLNSKPSIALGNWSYSIYLWHAPTHYAIMALFLAAGYSLDTLSKTYARMLLLATVALVICLSAASYRYLEGPARRFLLRAARNGRRQKRRLA
jgi:peptidoglycan/LPS O-acetylase OafA/YrhL